MRLRTEAYERICLIFVLYETCIITVLRKVKIKTFTLQQCTEVFTMNIRILIMKHFLKKCARKNTKI